LKRVFLLTLLIILSLSLFADPDDDIRDSDESTPPTYVKEQQVELI